MIRRFFMAFLLWATLSFISLPGVVRADPVALNESVPSTRSSRLTRNTAFTNDHVAPNGIAADPVAVLLIDDPLTLADITAPEVTVSVSPTGWTNGPVTVVIVATDHESGVKEIHCGTSLDATLNVVPGSSCTVIVNRLARVFFEVVDNAGNASARGQREICNIDTSAPLMRGPAVEDGSLLNGAIVAPGYDPSFTIPTAYDPMLGSCWNYLEYPGSGVAGYQVYWGTDPAGTSFAPIQTGLAFDPLPLTDKGDYYLRVSVWDRAGNQSPWSTAFIIRSSDQPSAQHIPVATVNAVRGLEQGRARGLILVMGTVSDVDGDLSHLQYSVDGGRSWVPLEFDSVTGRFSFEWNSTQSKDGRLELLVKSVDSGGHQSTAVISLYIDNWLDVFLPAVTR